MISIIVATYNRAKTLPLTISSILAQDYKNFEIIIVDDGSTDNTQNVIRSFNDDRIRIFRHDTNKGVCAAKNTGLNNIHGEWFTFLDSDDEMIVPNALSTLLNVVSTVNPEIDAITCNCIDSTTGKFSGQGLGYDQYLSIENIIKDMHGEHWGLTKTSLLRGDRFNEDLTGVGEVLWYKISKRATRYYIHKALRVYHTGGSDQITKVRKNFDIQKRYKAILTMIEESEFIEDLKKINPMKFNKMVFYFIMVCVEAGDKGRAAKLSHELVQIPGFIAKRVIIKAALSIGPNFVKLLRSIKY